MHDCLAIQSLVLHRCWICIRDGTHATEGFAQDSCKVTCQAAMRVAAHWEMQDSQKVCPQGSTSLFRTSATVPCLHAAAANVTNCLMQVFNGFQLHIL